MKRFRKVVFGFLFSVFGTVSANAQTETALNLTPQEMRAAAANAVVAGAPAQGYQIATALLQRNPNDTEA